MCKHISERSDASNFREENPQDRSSSFLWNVGTYMANYKESWLRRLYSKYSQPQELQVSSVPQINIVSGIYSNSYHLGDIGALALPIWQHITRCPASPWATWCRGWTLTMSINIWGTTIHCIPWHMLQKNTNMKLSFYQQLMHKFYVLLYHYNNAAVPTGLHQLSKKKVCAIKSYH